ncbi:alpha-hydroxy-acid oxidizing protein [Baekduia soli]|uniref:Alpha-hydroxy-acid oxidizing protein n=1 Tax=Baekduia soli TaxID=496014 RepID=A0A5B8U0L0_9ACTN|nr:alpha-hydroxy acid oxidase [Baekduia soli]QEC46511.1 alpha-hydroxy-acid oxidizing protein [Baekduia soli]
MDLSRLFVLDPKRSLARGPATAHTIDDLRRQAQRRLPRIIYDFVEGGAEDEITVRRNRAAFGEIGLEPEYLRDVATRDLSTTILGTRVASPVVLGPTGLQRLAHLEGELAAARAASALGSIYVAATASSYTIEEIAAVSSGPLWFQLYLWSSREVLAALVQRAKAVGCVALCLTIDVPVIGRRERDLRNGMAVPPRIGLSNALDAARRPRWLYGIAQRDELTYVNLRGAPGIDGHGLSLMEYMDQRLTNPGATWAELDWLRELWDGPLVVKGITSVADARRAVDAGVDGVVVSNHGGRQLDGAPATIERLPRIVDAIGDRAEVFLDGGVRRGTDVLKAMAMGARACLIGRPYWYGLGAGGEAGVRRCLEIFTAELDRALALVGRGSLAELGPDVVRVPPAWSAP